MAEHGRIQNDEIKKNNEGVDGYIVLMSWGEDFLFFFFHSRRAANRRPQLDGSGLRRYHAGPSAEAVKAHV